ncbi:hypothetical protein CANCADRAFT_42875 [Tortispora caseinolytica NRRL Y-17796]|uniref:t-SNARE coiled-coil homology domain-containing protein n=1 Tax=Tortispora caseinolytica NRRL Y-17796 TaxID=767744 RepID=A0A1E4TKJ3_9ASCO|nr:hypothetical protein CANCADRAFT_42875 [Tortispora caseinolytica NRRL Y-17796]
MNQRYQGLHQRDQRTQLFAASPIPRPNTVPNAHNERLTIRELENLEAQNEDDVEMLHSKVRSLKMLTTKIGDEIRESNSLLELLSNRFEQTGSTLKRTAKRMIQTAKNAHIPLKTWALFFLIVMLFFWLVRWL